MTLGLFAIETLGHWDCCVSGSLGYSVSGKLGLLCTLGVGL